MIMVGSMRLPVRVPLVAVVVVMMMAAFVARVRRGVHVGHDQLRAVLGRFPVVPPVAVLGASGLVKLLPRLPVVAVQSAAGLRRGGVEGGDGVAVR